MVGRKNDKQILMNFRKNYGVIEGRSPRDWVAGDIPYEIKNETGDWTPYLPPEEWQRFDLVDTMACVSFSLLNCIETQEKFLTGQQVNYSDRFIAMMSGTTRQGNRLQTVADTVRKYGLVREESWPTPINVTWESYYAVPDPKKMAELLAEGARWKARFDLAYGWVTTLTKEELAKHLKQCALQVVKPGHAIEGFKQVNDTHHYFDTYNPFKKTIRTSGLIDVLKPVLTLKEMPNQTKVVLSSDGRTVYKAVPIATSWEDFKKQASVEGIEIPTPIPPASTL